MNINDDASSPGGHSSAPCDAASAPNDPSPAMGDALKQVRHGTIQRCTDAAERAGHKLLFGMTTSLALQSVPLPDTCTLDTTLLHTVSSSHGKRVRKRGLTPGIIQPHVWRILDGAPLDAAPPGTAPLGTAPLVRITSRVYALDLFHTWAQLASYVPFESLIVLGDSIIRAVASQSTLARGRSPVEVRRDLLASIAAMPKFNGKTACLRAGALIAANVDSPKESECRLLLRRHGLPQVETGYTVPETRFRSGAAMTLDLAWPQWRIAVEYDGDHHRTDRKQWRRDQEKREYLRSRGWTVIIATAANLTDEVSRAEFAFHVARQLALRGAPMRFEVIARPVERLRGE